jgi:hypothetical protein
VADRTADICCFKSGGGLREGIIPIGLGLRAAGRMRFGPTARACRETVGSLRAGVDDGGGLWLCTRSGSVCINAGKF